MDKAHDRRFLGALGFLGTRNQQHLANFAWFALLALPALLTLVPRDKSRVPPQYRLERLSDISKDKEDHHV